MQLAIARTVYVHIHACMYYYSLASTTSCSNHSMQDDTDFLADKRKQEKACTVALVTKKRERIRELVILYP